MSIEVHSDLPFSSDTFAPKFESFQISGPLEENVTLSHHFTPGTVEPQVDESERVYCRPPWAIYEQGGKLIYVWTGRGETEGGYAQAAVADMEHSRIDIYNGPEKKARFLEGGLESLSMFPTDQILTGRLLAYRQGCIMHSLGIIMDGDGYLFVGHSDAGKSTVAAMLKDHAEILCDDRNIIRRIDGEYRLAGTWSHGDMPDVSRSMAPLKAIFFLHQSPADTFQKLDDEVKIFRSLLACLIRPLESRDWWERSMEFLSRVAGEVACCDLSFSRGGDILGTIREFNNRYGAVHA